jgi:hypothetical protein
VKKEKVIVGKYMLFKCWSDSKSLWHTYHCCRTGFQHMTDIFLAATTSDTQNNDSEMKDVSEANVPSTGTHI